MAARFRGRLAALILLGIISLTAPAAAMAETAQHPLQQTSATTAPQATLLAPAQDAEITAPADITGTASAANFAYYVLRLRPAGAPDSDWAEIGRGLAPKRSISAA